MFLILHSRSTLGILKVFFSSFLQALLQLSFYYQCPCYCKGYVCQQSKSFLCMTIQIPGFGRNTLGLRLLSVSTLTFVVSASALHLLLSFEQTLYYVLPYFLGLVKENQVGVRSFNIRILVYCDLTQSEFLPCWDYFVDQHNLASSVEVDTSRRYFQ